MRSGLIPPTPMATGTANAPVRHVYWWAAEWAELSLFARALEEQGHRISIGPPDHSLLERDPQPGIVIVDASTPADRTLTRRLRDRFDPVDLPILAVIGSRDDAAGALRCGATDVLTRPLDLDLVKTRVGHQLRLLTLSHRVNDLDRCHRELVGMVAHDLKQPLSTFALYLDVVENSQQPEHTLAAIAGLRRSQEWMRQLVLGLLDAVRVQAAPALAPVVVSLEPLLAQALSDLEPTAAANDVELCLEATGTHQVRVDPLAIWRVVTNLVANAIRFTPRGGVVHARLSPAPGHAVVEISDPGEGVPDELTHHLFRRFGRIHRPGQPESTTTGLGLFISKTLVAAHHGDIGYRRDGQRTVFWFSLPIDEGESR